ncbi:MAG: lysophospholipid acyltransferase family protein [Paludibacteraceae bacterium]
MKHQCALRLLAWCGWQINNKAELPDKCVVCIAPHTSNWDFVLGLLFRQALGVNIAFLMKKEWFRFPLGGVMRRCGGIPVDRSRHASLTDQTAAVFARHDHFYVAITPEGTRSYTRCWKRGFYVIAQKAQVPIMLAYIDYAKKELGFGRLFEPTNDIEADMKAIKCFYKNVVAKKPNQFGY